MIMIQTKDLTKEYNGFKAVDKLNLKVDKGQIYGFLGPNGAGKTTTILMLLGILKPTRGEIYIMGELLSKGALSLKKKIGVVSEIQHVYKEMTAEEYLSFFASIYRVKNKQGRIGELLSAVNLLEVKNKKLGTFSRGMQQKIGFARALLHEPQLLLLDEPVSGLDPAGIRQIRDLIERENKRGRTIFISSHLLSEVEKLCTKVAIINKGRLLAEDTMRNLRRKLTDFIQLEVELVEVKKEILDTLKSFEFVKEVDRKDKILTLKVTTDKDHRAEVSAAIAGKGGVVLGINTNEISLEEAFVTITQKNISLLTGGGEANR